MKYFYIDIDKDEKLGLQAVSLVDRPAVEANFLKFKDQKIVFTKDESKHIITGPSLIAEMPIYRRNQITGEEFYVIFTKDTIAKLVERYSQQNLFNSVNLQHDSDSFTDKVILIESYFVNKERGIAPKEYDLEDGSWITSYKVQDETLWNEIMANDEFKGFSVEVIANLVEKFASEKPEDETKETELNPLDEIIKYLLK